MFKKSMVLFLILCCGQAYAQFPPKSSDDSYPLDLKSIVTLPKTTDSELKRIYSDKSTIFYKLPGVWQHFVPASNIEQTNLTLNTKTYKTTPLIWGIYSVDFNPDSHANFNFPWETTIGLNQIRKESKAFRTVNFINLPKDEYGNVYPIWVIGDYPIKWIFPAETTVGEIIYVVYNNKTYVQEIRTRKKAVDSSEWEPAVYRSVANREEYIRLTGKNRDYIPAKKYMHFRNPQEDEVFKMEGFVERLPPETDDKVKELLSLPFKNVTDSDWSPCADQDFHILPKDYSFALLGAVESHNCSNCHKQTQISVRNLVPKDPSVINDPLGTGNIRGCDAVFTWHPFSYSCVRSSNKEQERQTSLRDYDLKNKIVKIVENPKSDDRYKFTLFVQEALKKYELPQKKVFLHNAEVLNTKDK